MTQNSPIRTPGPMTASGETMAVGATTAEESMGMNSYDTPICKPGTDTKFPAQFAENWLSVPGFAHGIRSPRSCQPEPCPARWSYHRCMRVRELAEWLGAHFEGDGEKELSE